MDIFPYSYPEKFNAFQRFKQIGSCWTVHQVQILRFHISILFNLWKVEKKIHGAIGISDMLLFQSGVTWASRKSWLPYILSEHKARGVPIYDYWLRSLVRWHVGPYHGCMNTSESPRYLGGSLTYSIVPTLAALSENEYTAIIPPSNCTAPFIFHKKPAQGDRCM